MESMFGFFGGGRILVSRHLSTVTGPHTDANLRAGCSDLLLLCTLAFRDDEPSNTRRRGR